MMLCKVDINASPLESILPINEVRLGAWKYETKGIVSFYSPGPKSYEMVFENDNGQLEKVIKCKGFSLCQDLIERCDQKDSFKRLVYDSLHPLDVRDDNSESDVNESSLKDGSVFKPPKMFMYQNRINIDSKTFSPKHFEMFKQLNVIGPQSVLNIADYVEFNLSKTIQKKRASVICRPPKWENVQCENFDTLDTLVRNESHELQAPFTDDTIQLYSVTKTSGLVPAYPFGYDLNSAKPLPFEKLALKPCV